MKFLIVFICFSAPAFGATKEINGKSLTFVISAEPLSSLLYQLDCVAEVSNCSKSSYTTYWAKNLGLISGSEEYRLVARWRELKKKYQGNIQYAGSSHGPTVVPPREDGFDLQQRIEIAQVTAKNIDELNTGYNLLLEPRDAQALVSIVNHFDRKVTLLWKKQSESQLVLFIDEMIKLSERIHLLDFFESVAHLMAADIPPQMKFYFHLIPQPNADQGSRAEQISNHSFVEVGPKDAAADRIDVVSHEAFHFFITRRPSKNI